MSIFHGENRFFGPPKVQEAYNIINFWFLMENSILKNLAPWMLKSPLTFVLKSIQSRFREAFDESGDDLKTCQENISFRLINRVLFSKDIYFVAFKLFIFSPHQSNCQLVFEKTRKIIKVWSKSALQNINLHVSDTLVPSMSFYSDFILILSWFCPNFWKKSG